MTIMSEMTIDLIAKAREHAESLRVVMQDQAATTIEDLCDALEGAGQLRSPVEIVEGTTITHSSVESETHRLTPFEPTDAMYEAGYNVLREIHAGPFGGSPSLGHAGKVFRTMLQAAQS